jgi:hypothetical protein
VDIDLGQPDAELQLLRALAGRWVSVKESRDDDPELPWIVSVKTLRYAFWSRGRTLPEARWRVIEGIALERLQDELRRLGWSDIDHYTDEAEFVVGRDPAGRMWGSPSPTTTLRIVAGSWIKSVSRAASTHGRSWTFGTSSTRPGSR